MNASDYITAKTRVVAKKITKDIYVISNSPKASLDEVYEMGYIVDADGEFVTPREFPIGTMTKDGYWDYYECLYDFINGNRSLTKDSLLGFAVGDAFGVPYEFLSRKQIEGMQLDQMIGADVPHDFVSRWSAIIPKGAWSDDTSMLIATMDSITENNDLNYNDMMDKFLEWFDKAKYTSTGSTFGVGGIIYDSLRRYRENHDALRCGGRNYMDNGNGSLMRILPVSLYCIYKNLPDYEVFAIISDASSITHAHEISRVACFIYTLFLKGLYATGDKMEAFKRALSFDYKNWVSGPTYDLFRRILSEDFINVRREDIGESGYVLDTLEAVMYSVLHSDNYEDTIKCAVKLGYDTDTVAGIAGSLAGALYGSEAIPQKWMNDLLKRDYLIKMAESFDDVVLKRK